MLFPMLGGVVAAASEVLPTATPAAPTPTPIPGGGEVSVEMTEFLAEVTQVFTSVMEWTSTVATTVMDNPLYLLPCVMGIACIGIGVFKRLINV